MSDPAPSPAEPLHETLYASAEKFARSGLAGLAKGDAQIFLLHGGTALEHLAKAMLARLHASLIVSMNPRQFASLLFLAGFERESGIRPDKVRTASLEEVLVRVAHLLPESKSLLGQLGPLVDGRNTVVHAALADRDVAETVAAPFLRACDLLLTAMERDRATFWAEHREVVDAREAASLKAAEIEALGKIAAAQTAFAERYGSLGDSAKDTLLAALVGTYVPEKHREALIECPACGTPALVGGSLDVDWEADYDQGDEGETYVVGAYAVVTFFPQILECRACGLHLEDEDELTAAGVERSWKLDDVDSDDFLEEPEWDWDDVRDYMR